MNAETIRLTGTNASPAADSAVELLAGLKGLLETFNETMNTEVDAKTKAMLSGGMLEIMSVVAVRIGR